MRFNRQNLKEMRHAVDVALKSVGERYDVQFSLGRITFTDKEFRGKLVCTARTPMEITDEILNSPEILPSQIQLSEAGRKYLNLCDSLGLKKEFLNKGFLWHGRSFRLLGMRARSYGHSKYQFLVEGERGGRYRMTLQDIKTGFNV